MGWLGTNGEFSNGKGPLPASAATTVASYAPASGELIGRVPIHDAAEVQARTNAARSAQKSWGRLDVAERARRMMRFKEAIADRNEEIADIVSRETGKPKTEALFHEVANIAIILDYFCSRAEALLAPRDIPLSLMKHRRAVLNYVPRGVVAVISPWNFPFYLPMRDVVLALLAGNAVVLKPSEVTPFVALKAKQIWDEAGLPPEVFQVVTGLGPTGAALIDAGIQLCVFTGGVATGRRVAAACGERLVPCVMELGGKAPLVVCKDADTSRAAHAAVFGGFVNAGQVCIAVERVYAHRDIHDELVEKMVSLTKSLTIGDPMKGTFDVGAITFPKQIEVAESHVRDALAKGATLRTGGQRLEGPGQFFGPTILTGCHHDMTVMTEEIFGPVVPVMRVESDDEAVRLANESNLGLNAYVFSENRVYAETIAERIEAGSVLVNDVLTNAACPELPFGGFKNSGFGRVLGDDSLREMCDVRHVNLERIKVPNELLGYPYTDRKLSVSRKLLRTFFGGGGILKKLTQLL